MPTSFSAAPGALADYPPLPTDAGRRSFVKYAGATATALALAGCSKHQEIPGTVNVGSADAGALNFAYALKQLEAAFYARVLAGAYFKNLTVGSAELQVFMDLARHERIHTDFLKAALITDKTTPIQVLTPNFDQVDFSDRRSVLSTAQRLEDAGVAALNGVAHFFSAPAYLLLVAKIVSVEARHAALVRDMLTPNSFVANDVVTLAEVTSLERSQTPTAVAATLNTFLAPGSLLNVAGLG